MPGPLVSGAGALVRQASASARHIRKEPPAPVNETLAARPKACSRYAHTQMGLALAGGSRRCGGSGGPRRRVRGPRASPASTAGRGSGRRRRWACGSPTPRRPVVAANATGVCVRQGRARSGGSGRLAAARGASGCGAAGSGGRGAAGAGAARGAARGRRRAARGASGCGAAGSGGRGGGEAGRVRARAGAAGAGGWSMGRGSRVPGAARGAARAGAAGARFRTSGPSRDRRPRGLLEHPPTSAPSSPGGAERPSGRGVFEADR